MNKHNDEVTQNLYQNLKLETINRITSDWFEFSANIDRKLNRDTTSNLKNSKV